MSLNHDHASAAAPPEPEPQPPNPATPAKPALDFRTDIELQSEYLQCKDEIRAAQAEYVRTHSELRDIMADYLQLLLHRKPRDVYAFTAQYFTI
ncbi:hypothetical protein HDU87_000035 [Geranomyces variabilis]|uniref:RIIa domain-containing protein n=1 Tax=Geranomyces variabilis TaxID=109894 RepID=A0AAD5TRX4_9FUNG|nr:hypothetical protein HDU87_000035 [Geranomyces variabilis]